MTRLNQLLKIAKMYKWYVLHKEDIECWKFHNSHHLHHNCWQPRPFVENDHVYMIRKIRKFRTDKFDTWKQTEILTYGTHVNGWEPAVYMSCMSQNFRLFHVSNLSVRNFRIFLLMYTWSMCGLCGLVLWEWAVGIQSCRISCGNDWSPPPHFREGCREGTVRAPTAGSRPPDPGHRAAAAPAGASPLCAPAVPGMSPFRLPSAAAGGGETARRVSFEWDATAGQSVAA